MLLSLPSPILPFCPLLPATLWVPTDHQRYGLSKAPSRQRAASGGGYWGAAHVWGAESWRVGECPHQVSRTHQHRGGRCKVENSSHLMMGLSTTVQLCSSEKMSWVRDRSRNGPGRWQEEGPGGRRRYPQKMVGTG